MRGQIGVAFTVIGIVAMLSANAVGAEWTDGTVSVTWELAPPSTTAVGEEFDATAAANYDANMSAGTEWEYTTVDITFQWEANPDGSVSAGRQPTGGSGGGVSYKSEADITYAAASTTQDDKTVRVRAHVTGSILDYGADGEKGTGDDVTYSIDQWSSWREKTLTVLNLDAIAVSCPDMFSVDKTNISVTAIATFVGSPVSGVEVSFSSADLTFSSGDTAVTDTNGEATILAQAGSSPSASEDGSTVTAQANDGIGNTISDTDDFTAVKVNDPTPANPNILDGGYSSDSLYSVLLTYTVSPGIAGVPVSFAFETGEGDGVNIPAGLEDPDATTNASGETTVRVRSSDLRETATVKCTYQASTGSTEVTFEGIHSVSGGEQE